METHQCNRFYGKNAAGVLIPKPLLLVLLIGLLAIVGFGQGSFAWFKSGLPILNTIAIVLIPIFGGVVALFVLVPIGTHYETKAKTAKNLLEASKAAAIAGLSLVAFFVGFPMLLLGSKNLGMPYPGLCNALLIPHWYHFVLAGVVSLIYSYNVILVWARRSANASKSASVVLEAH